MSNSMRSLPKGRPPCISRIAACNWSGQRVQKFKNAGMGPPRGCCDWRSSFGAEGHTFSLLAPINWYYFITFEWTTWGRGEPQEMKSQLMDQVGWSVLEHHRSFWPSNL